MKPLIIAHDERNKHNIKTFLTIEKFRRFGLIVFQWMLFSVIFNSDMAVDFG